MQFMKFQARHIIWVWADEVEPHGLKPVTPPQASSGGTLRSTLYYAPLELRRVPSPHSSTVKARACTPKCLPSPKRFVQADVTARRRGLLLPGWDPFSILSSQNKKGSPSIMKVSPELELLKVPFPLFLPIYWLHILS